MIGCFPLAEVGHIKELAIFRPQQCGGFVLHPIIKNPIQGELVGVVQPREQRADTIDPLWYWNMLVEAGISNVYVELGRQIIHAHTAGCRL